MHEAIAAAARRAANVISPVLAARLQHMYGPRWLEAVNARRTAEGYSHGRGLQDHRFCLALLGYDSATQGWADERWRTMARELNGLANQAAHDEPVTDVQAARAAEIATVFERSFVGSLAPTPAPHEQIRHLTETAARLHSAGDLAGAERALKQLIALQPASSAPMEPLVKVFAAAGRSADVLDTARRWQQLDPGDERPIYWQAEALTRLERCLEAMTVYRQAIDRVPTSALLRRQWWTCAVACGDDDAQLEAAAGWVVLAPHDVDALHVYAMALNVHGRPEEALNAAQRALALDPDNQRVLLTSARALCNLERWAEAGAVFQKCHDRNPTDQSMWFATLMAAHEAHDLAARLEISAGWTAALPDDLLAWVFRLRDLADSGQHEATIEAARRCLTLDPDNVPGREYYGMALYRTHRMVELAQFIDRWPEVDPSVDDSSFKAQPHLTLLKAQASADLQRWADAARSAALVTDLDDSRAAWKILVRSLLELDQPENALDAAERWVAIAPEDEDARIARVAALFRTKQMDRTVEAINEGWPGSDSDIHVLSIKAKALQALERHAEAVAAAARAADLAAVEQEATPTPVWAVQAWSLYELGHYDGAATAAQQLVKQNPQDPHHWFLLNRAYVAAKRWQEALDTAEREIEIHPSSGAWSRKAQALLSLRRPEEARPIADMLATLRPDDPDGLNLLTFAYAACGDLDTAIRYAQRWATVAPDSPDPASMLDYLHELKAQVDQRHTEPPPPASGAA